MQSTWLDEVEAQLHLICTSITQQPKKLRKRYMDVVLTNVGGAGASAGILGLVGTFGTASTGTAIAGLSGAAATSAKLFWVGSIVGGGVFAGGILTGGLGIGIAVLGIKYLNGSRREFEMLQRHEQKAFQTAVVLAKAIQDEKASPNSLAKDKLREFVDGGLLPLCKFIDENRHASSGGEIPYSETLRPRPMWKLFRAAGQIEELCMEIAR
ncbi:MAG: hypothetical protein JKY93_12365 [Gammaproteobacteria bacterium]|nr:hypothetical protein [Gammaproteobacteria bacterium]